MLGSEARPFEARLETPRRQGGVDHAQIINVAGRQVAALLNAGLSLRDIAGETGLSKSAVHRLKATMLAHAAARSADTSAE